MPRPPELSRTRLSVAAVEVVVWPGLIMVLGGNIRWIYGWALTVWLIVFLAGCMLWLYRNDSSLLAERLRPPDKSQQKAWDRHLLGVLLLLAAGWFVVMPLDAMRFRWTPQWSDWARALGALALLLGSFFLFRSLTDNTFLSPVVRMQQERKHKVVSTGVYGLVRHPMYLGTTLVMYGAPLLLGSALGLGIATLALPLLVVRTLGEERMLERELEGYTRYQQQVRYRLVPPLW